MEKSGHWASIWESVSSSPNVVDSWKQGWPAAALEAEFQYRIMLSVLTDSKDWVP